MKHQRAGTVINVLISDVSSQGNQATSVFLEYIYIYIHPGNIIWQLLRKERDLPMKCPQWAAHPSEAHGWTLRGTDLVWEAALSAELHKPLISLLESGSVSMDSDSLQPCVSDMG